MLSDPEIIARVLQGDTEAYAGLMERYQHAVYGVAYHYLRHAEDARDVAQEAFVQAYRHLRQLRDPARFGPWLRRLTVNQCHMWARRQHPTEPLDAAAGAAADPLEGVATRLVVQQAVARLPDESRLTLTLYYGQSYSVREIAAFLEVPETTIKSRLRNARSRLREELRSAMEEMIKPAPLPGDFRERVMGALFERISGPVGGWHMAEDERGNLWVGTECGLLIVPASSEEVLALSTIGRRFPALACFEIDSETGERRRVPTEVPEWVLIDTAHGLPHPQVRAFTWDRQGHLWAGTDRGLGRWDGASWKVFTTRDGLSHNEIHSLLVDAQGRLWAGTRHGLNRRDGSSWQVFTTENGLGGNAVWALLQDARGWIWAAMGDGGVSVFDGTAWKVNTVGSGLTCPITGALMEDSRGRVWVGQDDKGVSLFTGEGWEHIPDLGCGIGCLLEDSRGRVWVPTEGWAEFRGVTLLDPELRRIAHQPKGRAHQWNFAHSLLEDRRERIWMGTDEGLMVSERDRWSVYLPEDTLTDTSVIALLEDAAGRIWMGTYLGVVVNDHGQWRTFTAVEGLRDPTVYCLLANSKGRLWAGTFGGLHVLAGNRWEVQELPADLSCGVTAVMEDDDGRLWVGAEQGLGVPRESGGWEPVLCRGATRFEESSVNALFQDREGQIWIGTRAGLTVFAEGEWRPAEALPGEMAGSVHCLFEDSRGWLWAGGAWGASVFDGRQWQTHRFAADLGYERPPLGDEGEPLPAEVRDIEEDARGRIWAATGGGGVYVREGEEWRRVGLESGLSSSCVYSLLIDREDRLWVGTHLGGICLSRGRASEL